MILFLDTSALVKLYIVEADSPVVHASVARAETVAVCRIAWAEACAALARRAREVPADETAIIAARQALEASGAWHVLQPALAIGESVNCGSAFNAPAISWALGNDVHLATCPS